MTAWVPIVLTAIGSGALGSVITAYGTQTRERRQARAQAREASARCRTSPSRGAPGAGRRHAWQLETSAMLAGLPKKLTALNRQARRWWRTRRLCAVMDTWPRPGPRPRQAPVGTQKPSGHGSKRGRSRDGLRGWRETCQST